MAKATNPRKSSKQTAKISSQNKNPKQKQNYIPPKPEKPASWAVVRSFFTCKHLQAQQQQQQQQQQQKQQIEEKPKNPKQQQKLQQKQKQQQIEELQKNSKLPQQQKQQQKQKQQQTEEKQEKQKHPQQQKQQRKQDQPIEENNKKCKKMNCSGSLCSNTNVMHRPEASSSSSPENQKKRAFSMGSCNNNIDGSTSSRSMKTPLKEFNGPVVNSSFSMSVSSNYSPLRGIPFRKLSGCYECKMVVDPVLGFTRDPSLRATICSCPECGEIFMKAENLELHQTVRHAVSELGPEDTSKNIVEIIFQSSWLRKQSPVCKIDRILKIQNTSKTISRFEEYRDTIKAKATKLPKKHPRCIADGNELLRFHCTTFVCSLGLNGSSNLCNSIPHCGVCSIIKYGFRVAGDVAGKGILTTATSGKAHDDSGLGPENEKRAMLVCRVIAGRVKKGVEGTSEEYDSVAETAGVYANFDELYVVNPKAILPCFVVIYGGF